MLQLGLEGRARPVGLPKRFAEVERILKAH